MLFLNSRLDEPLERTLVAPSGGRNSEASSPLLRQYFAPSYGEVENGLKKISIYACVMGLFTGLAALTITGIRANQAHPTSAIKDAGGMLWRITALLFMVAIWIPCALYASRECFYRCCLGEPRLERHMLLQDLIDVETANEEATTSEESDMQSPLYLESPTQIDSSQ